MAFVDGLMGPCFAMAESSNYTWKEKKIILNCQLAQTYLLGRKKAEASMSLSCLGAVLPYIGQK